MPFQLAVLIGIGGFPERLSQWGGVGFAFELTALWRVLAVQFRSELTRCLPQIRVPCTPEAITYTVVGGDNLEAFVKAVAPTEVTGSTWGKSRLLCVCVSTLGAQRAEVWQRHAIQQQNTPCTLPRLSV